MYGDSNDFGCSFCKRKRNRAKLQLVRFCLPCQQHARWHPAAARVSQNTLHARARVKPPSAMMVEPPIDLVRPVTAYPEARASTEQTEPVHLKDLLKPGKPFVLHLYTP